MATLKDNPCKVCDGSESAARILLPSGLEAPLGPGAFTHSVALTPGTAGPARPDPESEALRSRIAEQRRTGEWEDWFVDLPEKQDEYMRIVGLPRQLRERAAPQLRRLYSPKVCVRMQEDDRDRQVVGAFFNRWLPWIDPFIRLGLDLEVAQPWSDRKLLGDLRSFENFATAQTELEVWASLVRSGCHPEREPRGPDGRRPDFAAYAGGMRYIVEVKTLRPSDGENLANDIRTAMQTYADHLRRPGQSARVYATGVLRRLLNTAAGRASVIGADGQRELGELGATLRKLGDNGSPLGTYAAGPWFTVEIVAGTDHPAGMVSAAVWDGPEDERRAVRIATLVGSALPQIPPAADGVPVIEIVRPMDIGVVARVLRHRAQQKPVTFSPVAFVVLRWTERVSPTEFRHNGTAIPMRRIPMGPDERLVQALIG